MRWHSCQLWVSVEIFNHKFYCFITIILQQPFLRLSPSGDKEIPEAKSCYAILRPFSLISSIILRGTYWALNKWQIGQGKIHSFVKQIFTTYHVLGIILAPRNIAVKKTKRISPPSCSIYSTHHHHLIKILLPTKDTSHQHWLLSTHMTFK